MARLTLTISKGSSPITDNSRTKVDIDIDDGVYSTDELASLFETLTDCAGAVIANVRGDDAGEDDESPDYPPHTGAILFDAAFPHGYETHGDITHAGVQNYIAATEAAG